jgi:ornithine cyclodeaminase
VDLQFPGQHQAWFAARLVILNDPRTGYPMGCLEASIISAARTAASAALAARHLTRTRKRPRRLGIVGLGLIARYTLSYLTADGWEFDEIHLHDLDPGQPPSFAAGPARTHAPKATIAVHGNVERLIESSDLILFATVAAQPHITDKAHFAHHPVVLHLSLRDLAPEILLDADNIVDDVDHCLRAATSAHLTEQRSGDRDFVTGTLYDVMTGQIIPAADRTVIFSPFGLGVLDLAVARHVWQAMEEANELCRIPGFFRELSRHG